MSEPTDRDDDNSVRRPRPRAARWGAMLGLGAALSGAMAATVILVVARHKPDSDTSGFTAKGGAATAVLSARCLGRDGGRCKVGDKLVFEIDGPTTGGLLAAYVERADGERVWYFPTRERHFPTVPAGNGRTLISEVARLGDELGPGRHTLHVYVVDGRMDREALVTGAQRPRVSASIPLLVEP